MDLPRESGLHQSATGKSAPGVALVAVCGQVHRYGPRRWWVPGPLALLVAPQEVELVWTGPEHILTAERNSDEWLEQIQTGFDLAIEEAERAAEKLARRRA